MCYQILKNVENYLYIRFSSKTNKALVFLFFWLVVNVFFLGMTTPIRLPRCQKTGLRSFKRSNLTQSLPFPPLLNPHTQWKPPPNDLFKINFDGAIFSNANNYRIGVVIQNNQGLVIASLTQQLPKAYCPNGNQSLIHC